MPGEFLRVVRGAAESAEVRVDDELLLGREVDGDGNLGDSPEISRRHARLSRAADGALQIQDLGSLNGTLVNGERIERTRRLAVGDTVKLGDALLVVVDATGRSAQPTVYGSAAGGAVPKTTATRSSEQRSRGSETRDFQLIAIALIVLAVAFAVFMLLR